MAFYPAQEITGLHPHQATKVLNKCHVCSNSGRRCGSAAYQPGEGFGGPWEPGEQRWKITSVRKERETIQGLESGQGSRTLLSCPQAQAPRAGEVDAHLGGLSGLKTHRPHWCLMLHHQHLSPLGCLSGHPLEFQPPTFSPSLLRMNQVPRDLLPRQQVPEQAGTSVLTWHRPLIIWMEN